MSSRVKMNKIEEYCDCSNCHGRKTIGMFNMWWTGTEYESAGECKNCGMIWLSTKKYDDGEKAL